MINNELLEYIKHQLDNKVSREVITGNLKVTGWTDADVDEAFVAISPLVELAPVLVSTPVAHVFPTMIYPVAPIVDPIEIKTVTPNVIPIISPDMTQVQSPFVTQIQPIIQPSTQPTIEPIIEPVIQPESSVINPVTSSFSYQQPVHKSNGKKIIITIIIFILLGVGGGFYFYKTQILKQSIFSNIGLTQTNVIATVSSSPLVVNNAQPIQTKTAQGITISFPSNLTFSDGSYSKGIKEITISNGAQAGDHIVLAVDQYANQKDFLAVSQDEYKAGVFVNDRFTSVGGLPADVYEFTDTLNNAGTYTRIYVPSKLTIILMMSPSFVGVSQEVLNMIVNSINFQ